MKGIAFGVAAALLMTGCATSSDVRNAPLTSGIEKEYEAPYSQVKRLALESVQGLNLDVKSTNEVGELYTVEFSKGMSLTSWGEVGRVNVMDIPKGSRVSVLSSKRSKYQITGTNEEEFANSIFEGIDHALAGE